MRTNMFDKAALNRSQAVNATLPEKPTLAYAAAQAEQALGDNLMWLNDMLDLQIRQGNKDVIARLKRLNDAWINLVKALA